MVARAACLTGRNQISQRAYAFPSFLIGRAEEVHQFLRELLRLRHTVNYDLAATVEYVTRYFGPARNDGADRVDMRVSLDHLSREDGFSCARRDRNDRRAC